MKDQMTRRERVLAAIRRQPLDRIPTDIWATAEVSQKLLAHFGSQAAIQEALQIDGMAGLGAPYTGPAPAVEAGESADYWGIRSRPVAFDGGVYHEMCFHPLAAADTIDELERYRWPDADWFDYTQLREQAAAAAREQVLQCGYMAPFFMHNKLRGLETSMMDPLIDPDYTHHLLTRICDFIHEHHRRIFEACDGLIDVAQVTDDLGSQTGPLISLDVYREFYAPHHRRFCQLCQEFGITIMHHDDGAMAAFLPDLLEMGIEILNPIQWTCPGMEMDALKRTYGSRLCFHGAMENQQILPFGTPEAVRAEVRHCIDALAADGTGYVLAPCHNLQAITPIENIIAMYDEAHTYGRQ